MEKVCTKCGNEYSKDVKFCVRCGSNLVETKVESIQKNEQPSPQRSQHEMQRFNPTKSVAFKKSRPVEKLVIPAIIIAIILSLVAIALPMVLEANKIAKDSVGTDQIVDGSITGDKISDGTITDNNINSNGLSKIADDSITSQKIHDGTIDITDLSQLTIQDLSGLVLIANNSITGNKIADGTIESVDIKNNTITNFDIAPNAVNTEELADNAVTYNKMNIKIKYGTQSDIYNNTVVTHGLGSVPTSVIVTPVHLSTVLNGNYVIFANVHSITTTSFTICLWYMNISSSPAISVLNSASPFDDGIDVNWIAIK